MYSIKRTQQQIDDVLNEASRLSEVKENPYWGQTYAEGVEAALQWVFGNFNEPPLVAEEPEKPAAKKHK